LWVGTNNIKLGNIKNANIDSNLVLINDRPVRLRKIAVHIEINLNKDNIKKVDRNYEKLRHIFSYNQLCVPLGRHLFGYKQICVLLERHFFEKFLTLLKA